jgi:hypothetical protein
MTDEQQELRDTRLMGLASRSSCNYPFAHATTFPPTSRSDIVLHPTAR